MSGRVMWLVNRIGSAPEKPAFRAPCNGCGFCCAAEVCKVGLAIHGESTEAPCPSLVFRVDRFACQLVEIADRLDEEGVYLRSVLGIGKGCDAQTDEEVEEAHFRPQGDPPP